MTYHAARRDGRARPRAAARGARRHAVAAARRRPSGSQHAQACVVRAAPTHEPRRTRRLPKQMSTSSRTAARRCRPLSCREHEPLAHSSPTSATARDGLPRAARHNGRPLWLTEGGAPLLPAGRQALDPGRERRRRGRGPVGQAILANEVQLFAARAPSTLPSDAIRLAGVARPEHWLRRSAGFHGPGSASGRFTDSAITSTSTGPGGARRSRRTSLHDRTRARLRVRRVKVQTSISWGVVSRATPCQERARRARPRRRSNWRRPGT